MNHLRTILAALLFAAAPAAAQTIKTLGYDTGSGNVVAATNLTFTNSLNFATNARAATRTNLGGTAVGNAVFTATNAAAAANAIGLGTSNSVFFSAVEVGEGDSLYLYGSGVDSLGFGGELNFEEQRFTQDDLTVFSWATNSFSVTPPATFSTNVTVNGTLTVKSLTTTDPVGWALDAVQTAAATNGVLTLPDAANVLRITNANAISSVTNGRLGAFYYLVNQTTNNLTISNAGGITVQGGTPLTLGANQAATLVATGPTNASVAARGDLNDVTLGGTANTAPNQTAASGSSLMTRDLTDQRQIDRMIAGPRMVWLTTFTGWSTAVSGGSVAQNQYLRASSGTNQWNYAVARNFQSGELFSGAGDQFNFSKAGSFGTAYYTPGASYRDGTDVIYLGVANTYVPSTGSAVSNPATKGFGWRIKDESIVATMFATNYVELATNSTVLSAGASTRQNVWLYIDWDGAGGASWYVDGNEIASTTNGPTGLTSVNQGWLIFGSVADIPLTSQNANSVSAFLLDLEP